MGNPLGLQFANSVTSGIISASERTIDAETTGGDPKVSVLQTDAAINPGNSGGALVDINGNLVGINSMKIAATQVEGIGFAIPSNEVKVTIEQLVKHGKIDRPSIGIGLINLKDIPEEERESNFILIEKTVFMSPKLIVILILKKVILLQKLMARKLKMMLI